MALQGPLERVQSALDLDGRRTSIAKAAQKSKTDFFIGFLIIELTFLPRVCESGQSVRAGAAFAGVLQENRRKVTRKMASPR